MDSERPIKILCVDDEKNVIRALRRLFIEENYEIFSAGTGEEGLTTLEREGQMQVIIADYRMPGMNGVEFLREVCRRWPDTVRIVLSGYAETAAVVSAINEGQIFKFVPKPWNDEELKVTIDNAVEMYQLQQKNRELLRELQVAQEQCQLHNHHLEGIVEKRTRTLQIQNEALMVAQSILNALPVAVLGIGNDDQIAHWNQRGMGFLVRWGIDPLGSLRRENLPQPIGRFLAEVGPRIEHSATVECDGQVLRLAAAHLNASAAGGLVLAFWEEIENG